MRAEVITIGDELLRGEIVDSNKSLLSERLLELDVETRFHTSVGDHPEDMSDAFRRAVSRADIVLVSGGLGPTRDDLTSEVLARCFGRKLVLDEEALATLRGFFERLGREMAPTNEKQAWFPDGAEMLLNPIGTAPGFCLREGGAQVFCMPGVPRELRRMMDEQVLPRIAAGRSGGRVTRATLLRTFGIGESSLDHALAGVCEDPEVTIGFRTAFPDNFVRPLVRAAGAGAAEAKLGEVCGAIRARLGPLVYGEGDETLEAVAARLLCEAGRRVAVAEGSTGGLLAERLSSAPDAAAAFAGGVVAWGAGAKAALLGVDPEALEDEGADPERTAVVQAMARAVCERLGADYGLATAGGSEPEGVSAGERPEAVCVALAGPDGVHAERFLYPLDRVRQRALAVQTALDWLRRSLLGVELRAPALLRRRS